MGALPFAAFGGDDCGIGGGKLYSRRLTRPMDKPLWGLRVQAPFGAWVQKVQRVQRVVVSPSRAMSMKSALRDLLSVPYGMISILRIGSLRSPLSGFAGLLHGKACHTIPSGAERWWRQPSKGGIFSPAGRLYGFRRQRRYKKWRRRRRTSPAGTVSQPIGKPFNGQAKGLLWLTWRSYAGPPQYYITPEGESPQPACKAKPITGRTLAAQGRKARRLAQPSRP